MAINMDEQQTKAVQSSGKNILVSASAGAGKTRVLVERLIKRCTKDHVGMDEILALTFTAAAAAEMKNRTAARLLETLNEETDPAEKEWIRKQMILLDSADITTIDAFCLKIIQKYCSLIGLDPDTARHVLDDASVDMLMQEAFRDAVRAYDREHHETLLKVLEIFSARSENYDNLKKAVEDILAKAGSTSDPEGWIESARRYGAPVKSMKDMPADIREWFTASLRMKLDGIIEKADRLPELAKDSPKLMKKADELEAVRVRLQNCRNRLEEGNYDLFRESFIAFGEEYTTPADGAAAEYTAVRKALAEACDRLASVLYDSSVFVKDHNENAEIVSALCDLSLLSRRFFLAKKQAAAAMDFTDMEHYAFEILQAAGGAAAEVYRNRLKEVMVDEFQDTSSLQDEIIRSLAKPGTIFRVGDVKQSIYRFRQAKPSLMRSLMEDADTMQITLKHNYRSMDTVVEFCNELFTRLMNVRGAMDTYSEKDRVSTGAPYQISERRVPVRFALLPADPSSDEEETPQKKQVKAMYIAREIQRLNEEEGFDWRDFAVLVRSHTDKGILRSTFEQYGIPYDIDAREGFYNSPLCRVVCSMMEWMCEPDSLIPSLAVLTSPFCRISDEEIAGMKLRGGSVLKGLQAEHPEILREMKELYEIGCRLGITAMLSEIALRHDFYEALDNTQKANFDLLFETAVNMEHDGRNFYDLLDRMRAGTDEKSSEAVSRGKDDHVVTVTTIHQSKGLQYPVVFLWSTETSRPHDSSPTLLVDEDLYFGLQHIGLPHRLKRPTVSYLAAAHKSELEDLEEYTRLLYVPLSRAEKQPIIVDALKKEPPQREEITLSTLAERKGMSGLILSALRDIPGLFRIEYPDIPEVIRTDELRGKYVSSLVRFSAEAEHFAPLLTPSRTEARYLPDLETSISGKLYGRRIHEIIASLPDRRWTEDDPGIADLPESDREKLLNFSDSKLYERALQYEIRKEFPFYIETEEIRMHGVMDFAAFAEDRIILIDFKTDHTVPKELMNRYGDQIRAYRTALQAMYPGKEVEAYLWSFYLNKEIEVM